MISPAFVWCDLSTFDVEKAYAFYSRVFGWETVDADGSGKDGYKLLYTGKRESAGLYRMPDFFQGIRMPSFWMSYVHVASLEETVEIAVRLGAKCEIEPTAFDAQSRFALIRDPSGAGFTLYEGPDLGGRDGDSMDRGMRPGRMVWNELHVPAFDAVEPFYHGLFGWEATPSGATPGRYLLRAGASEPVGSIVVLDESTKGPKNYWAVVFAVGDADSAAQAAVVGGGEVLSTAGEGLGYAMLADDQGAMFCVTDQATG